MTNDNPQVIQVGSAVSMIQGDLGKPFLLFPDFRSILLPAMTVGTYHCDE